MITFQPAPAELGLELLDDLAVAAHRAVEALEVAVDDEEEVVESLARSERERAERLGLVALAVAHEAPDARVAGVVEAAVLEVPVEAGVVHGVDRAEAHRHRRVLPEVGHQARVGVRRQAAAADLATEVVEVVLAEPPFEVRAGVDAGRRVALDVDRVAGLAVVLAPEEVVEADLVEARARGEGREMPPDPVGVLVRPDDHDGGVPADERSDAALDQLIAGEPGLTLGGDRVDVGRAHRRGEADLQLAGPLEELADEEPRPGLAVDVDDAVEAVEPLLRLFGVDVGKLVHEPVEDHGPHSPPAPIVSGAPCQKASSAYIQAMRPELVDFLRAHGLSDDEIAEAGEGRELIDLTLSMAILPSRRAYTLAEAAERAGADPEAATRLWRAMGFPDPEPDDRVATDIDVMALQGALESVHNDEELEKSVEQTRIIAGAVSVVAEVWTDSLTKAAEEMADAGVGADDVALRFRDSLELERLSFLLDYLHRRQLIAALERRLYWSPDSALSDQVLTVGFADLTGYTSLTQQLTGPELDILVARFESLTRDVIAEYGGRVVKTIGDEVMFLCANPIAGADLALRLVEAHTEDDILPPVKVGLDCGPILLRDGDAFGPTVNRASRLVDLAKPATVVVPSAVRDVLDGEPGFRLRPLGVRRLKDIGSTWLWAVARSEQVA